jgi:type II secretory ATPase GspE/PulE/Tfp pilus assembly ATPase PilB-like protein
VAQGYSVTCWNCLGEYDASAAVWCSDDAKNPTKLCPFCLRCFCSASAEYKEQFWRDAPPQLIDELETLTRSGDRLGEILIRTKKLTTPQLLEALVEQRQSGGKLGEILTQRGLVSRQDVEDALRDQGTKRQEPTQAAAAQAATPYWHQSSPDSVLDAVLALGARKRASDVILEPQPDGVAIRYRVDGFSFRVDPVPKSFESALERAVFAMFGLDPARRARVQSGRATVRLGEDDYDLVAQTVPGRFAVGATIKLVNRTTFIKDFATLGLELEDRVRLVEAVRSGAGLILLSSPASNGAITTSYSLMTFLANAGTDVLSIECPIHWRVDRVRQVAAEADEQGPRIEAALRPMLPVRPRAVMVSAVPDAATATLLAELASSLLVVAQVTAPTAARAVAAVRELGVAPPLLARALGLAVGQRLVREVCRTCRVAVEVPPAATLAANGIGAEEARSLQFFRGDGCAACHTVGYRGRRAVFETLPATSDVRAAVEAGCPAEEIHRAGLDGGMIDLRSRCLALVRSGLTTFEEFARLSL